MSRKARVVLPGLPHHVTQRGSRKMQTFFSEEDFEMYLEILDVEMKKRGVALWCYCLMPNHVHHIATPRDEQGLSLALGEAHRRYALQINRREGWCGHLWQERYHSCPMDDSHLLAAVRYVLQNPVRAKLVSRPQDWKHSSARAHLGLRRDPLVDTSPMADRVGDWSRFLGLPVPEIDRIRKSTRLGLPIGARAFIQRLEKRVGRRLVPARPGRPSAG